MPGLWNALKKDLDDAWDKMPKKNQKKRPKENNSKDSSIAEAAKFNDCMLLTYDRDLATVAGKHGIKVLRLTSNKSS